MARYLACIIYRLFTKGQAWVDRGAEHFEQNRQTRDLARLSTPDENSSFRRSKIPQPWPGGGLQFRLMESE
jgi:hypothetical protein